jgi:hypothetical protein
MTIRKLNPKSKPKPIDYDALWKEFITDFLEDSIAMLNPELHKAVDWSVPPVYLEQELLNALKGKYKIKDKRKFTDKLIKLRLKSGKDHFVLLHAEAQHEPEDFFNKRMYIYRSLIFLRYDIEDITAIALFTGAPPKPELLEYRHSIFGTELFYRFNSYIIAHQNEAELLVSDNPFAIAVLAAMYVLQTKNDAVKRFSFKKNLFILAQQKKIPKEKLLKLLIFVRDFIELPNPLENEFAAGEFSNVLKNDTMFVMTEGKRIVADVFLQSTYNTTLKEIEKNIRTIKKFNKEVKRYEQDLIQAERDRVQAEQDRIQAICNFYSIANLSPEVIAKAMNLDIKYVQEIITKHKETKK